MRIDERGQRVRAASTARALHGGLQWRPAPSRLQRFGVSQAEGVPQPRLVARGRAVLRSLVRLVGMAATWPRRRRVVEELSTFSDHQLADIGLSRSDIGRVFDPEFERDRFRRGAAGTML